MKNSTKWLAALLFISIAANIYTAGTVLGQKKPFRHPSAAHDPRFSLRQLTSGLPKDIRRQIGAAIKEQHESLMPIVKKQKRLRARVIELLSAPEVDAEKLRKIFNQQRIIAGDIQTPAHEALLKVLPTVDQKTRLAMIEHMRQRGLKRQKPPRKQDQEKAPQ